MATWLPWIILAIVVAYMEARNILARGEFERERQRWEGRESHLLDRIQAQSPGVLQQVHAKDAADERLDAEKEARKKFVQGRADTHVAGVVMPPSEASIASARLDFEELVKS